MDFGFCVELPIKVQRKKFNYTEIASHERRRISGKKNVNEFIHKGKHITYNTFAEYDKVKNIKI